MLWHLMQTGVKLCSRTFSCRGNYIPADTTSQATEPLSRYKIEPKSSKEHKELHHAPILGIAVIFLPVVYANEGYHPVACVL